MRAKPIVIYGLIASASALSGPVSALGLGKLTVDSALGQPLSARIELTAATREELDTLTARVADPQLYRENNLAYQPALGRTRITLETTGGTPYLRVTSPVSVQEPYLDLMVELNWAAGRVVREYTFLLDPPGTNAPMFAEPVSPTRTTAAPAQRAPSATTQATAPQPRPEGDQYTVKRGDTLSKIANQCKPQDVTLDQMLVALFKGNEAAFDGKNMNRLRSGAIITIPPGTDLSAATPQDATKVVRAQVADWRAYRDRVAAAAPEAEAAGGRAAGGQIGAAVGAQTPAPEAGRDRLRVSREAGTGKGGGAEDTVAREKQLVEAQARINELEKTVKDMQRVIDLKSPTMASAQAQAEAAKGKGPEAAKGSATSAPVAKGAEASSTAPSTPATTTAATTPSATPTATPPPATTTPPATTASTTPPSTTAATPAASSTTTPPAATTTETKAGETPTAPITTAETKATTETKAPPPKAPPKAVPKAPAKEPPGFLDDILGGTPWYAILAGVIVILGGITWLFASRRRKTTKFEDSIISGTDIKTNTVFGSTGGGVVNTGDNSLQSDFSREGLGSIDTDEVDPIAEAEVYLAYGRDAQAEEILKDALKKDPQRQEIYLKLLEIHAQHNKPSAFETVASELYAISQGQGEVWKKAVALGRTLDPNNPLFSEGGAPPAAAPHPAAQAMAAVEEAHATEKQHRQLDSLIDEEISISPTSGAKPKTPMDILAGAEQALEKSAKTPVAAVASAADRAKSSVAESATAATAALAGALAASKSQFESSSANLAEKVDTTKQAAKYDLDFHLDDAEKPAPIKPRAEPRLEPALAAAPASGGASASQSLTRPAAALELDKLDLSFDPDRSTYEDPTPSVLDGQWHDAATKLDLAKAYQEMGDVEGAREILQEVLHEGDDQQKSEAKALLAKLG